MLKWILEERVLTTPVSVAFLHCQDRLLHHYYTGIIVPFAKMISILSRFHLDTLMNNPTTKRKKSQ